MPQVHRIAALHFAVFVIVGLATLAVQSRHKRTLLRGYLLFTNNTAILRLAPLMTTAIGTKQLQAVDVEGLVVVIWAPS